MKDFIETYDNALTEEECKYIIDYMNADARLVPGRVQSGVNTNVKDSFDIEGGMNLNDNIEIYKYCI